MAVGLADDPLRPKEIKDREDSFYRRVTREFTSGDGTKLNPGAFGKENEVDEGISFDWGKYSTPQETLARTLKPQIKAGVVKTTAGQVWDCELNVRHAPEAINLAHSLVTGPSETRVRKTLTQICEWEIRLPPTR